MYLTFELGLLASVCFLKAEGCPLQIPAKIPRHPLTGSDYLLVCDALTNRTYVIFKTFFKN